MSKLKSENFENEGTICIKSKSTLDVIKDDMVINKNCVVLDLTDRNYAKYKIGDGVTKYSDLKYVSAEEAFNKATLSQKHILLDFLIKHKNGEDIGMSSLAKENRIIKGEHVRDNFYKANIAKANPILVVRYHREKYPNLPNIVKKGNFYDLYSAEEYHLKKGEYKLINLGISVKIPEGHWLQIVPRSSTFKNYKVIQTNSFGVIDTDYCGDNDIVMMPVYALEDTIIKANERICQFTLQKDTCFDIVETEKPLEGPNRGGIGSTGKE